MADLDDFFKKRDKKKKTTKSKFVTLDTDEFAKQLEATTIRNIEDEGELQENAEFGSNQATNLNLNPSSGDNLDEEWKPFDSEENKDYSGLRIKIQNWKVEDEENNNEGVIDEQEKKVACPWLISSGSANKQEEQENIEPNEVKSVDSTSKETSKQSETSTSPNEPVQTATSAASTASTYVPPHLRKKAESEPEKKYVPPSMRTKTTETSAIPPTSVNYRKPNKSQPNIMDTLEFPTLNAAASEPVSEKMTNGAGEKFELPKKSGRVESKTGGHTIDLENKFTALSNN